MLQYILALLTILVFLGLIFRKPKVETYVLFIAFALPLIDAKILPLEYGFIKVYDVVTLISLLLFFKEFISFKSSIHGKIYLILVILFWFFLLISKISSDYPLNNLHFLYQPFTIFIYARFLFIYWEEKMDALYKFISAFQVSVIILTAVVFIQLILGPNFSYLAGLNANVINVDTAVIRYPSLFQDSQNCGQFLCISSFSLLFLNTEIENKKKYFFYINFVLTVVALFLAGSRSAVGGWLCGIFILFLFQNLKMKIIALVLVIFGGILFYIVAPEGGVFSRTETISEDYLFRKSIWEETSEIIEKYPILGIGFGNYQKYIKRYHQDLYLQTEDGGEFYYLNQPENGYLKILVEQGFIGFIIFLLLLLLPLTRIFKIIIQGKNNLKTVLPVAALLSWSIAFTTVYSLLDYRILIAVATYVCLTIFHNQNSNLTKNIYY